MDNIVIYENNVQDFDPLHHLRAVYEIPVGIFDLLHRINFLWPQKKLNLFVREYLKSRLSERYPKYGINMQNIGLKALFINGRAVNVKPIIDLAETMGDKEEFILFSGDEPVAFFLKDNFLNEIVKEFCEHSFEKNKIASFFKQRPQAKLRTIENIDMIFSLPDCLYLNGKIITEDFELLQRGGLILSNIPSMTYLKSEKNIYIGRDCKIDPFVYINAEAGPVFIGDRVHIKAHTLIEGPVFIDNDCQIFSGNIKANNSFHTGCRVGGEVGDSIFMSYVNKKHEGFVGHTFAGEWVNFGALTTTSNLKNNYGKIALLDKSKAKKPSAYQFLGSLIGDHSKFGIGTMLNSGTIVGVGVNLAMNQAPGKRLNEFTWLVNNQEARYDFNKFVETTKAVMARRALKPSEAELKLLAYLYENAFYR